MTEEVFAGLKRILRAHCAGLVTVDVVFGYMQCLLDLDYLKTVDIRFILECLCSKDSADREWIFK